jgi:hypothetical protein
VTCESTTPVGSRSTDLIRRREIQENLSSSLRHRGLLSSEFQKDRAFAAVPRSLSEYCLFKETFE